MTTPPPEFPPSTTPGQPTPPAQGPPPVTPGDSPMPQAGPTMTAPQAGPTMTPEALRQTRWARRKKPALIIGGVALLAVLLSAFMVFGGSPDFAKVGQCMKGERDDGRDFKVVKCEDARATWRIVGKIDYPDDAAFEVVCKDFPTAEGGFSKSGRGSFMLCLEPLTK